MDRTSYKKMFGVGPLSLLIGVTFFILFVYIDRKFGLPKIPISDYAAGMTFVISFLFTIISISWTLASLPMTKRGHALYTQGIYKYVRHPLYASVLNFLSWGLAILFKSYLLLSFALFSYIFMYYMVRREEKFLIELFGDEYRSYMKKTKRFIPGFF